MASADKCYPDYLNPFGSDEEGDGEEGRENEYNDSKPKDEYPDYLSPFDDIDEQEAGHTSTANKTPALDDDYDDSLNPFGDEDPPNDQLTSQQSNHTSPQQQMPDNIGDLGEGNPFAEDLEEIKKEMKQTPVTAPKRSQHVPSVEKETFNEETTSKAIATSSLETLDKPPVPLPRTKSLLKKELAAQRLKQQQLQQQQQLKKVETSNHHAIKSPQLAERNDSVLEEER